MLSRLPFVPERWGMAPEGIDPFPLMKKYREKICKRLFCCFFPFPQFQSSRSKGASA